MIKRILVTILVVTTSVLYSQQGTSSPYSFFGRGLQNFKGTIENRSMGGLSILGDSIHLNLQNPAGFGNLKLTTYSIGTTYTTLSVKGADESYNTDNATLEYLAVGIPAGKFGFGFGLIPYNLVGYRLTEITEEKRNQFTGKGGVNKVFLNAGYQVTDELSIGADVSYSFGSIENKVVSGRKEVQYGTREITTSRLSGLGLSFGLMYNKMITDKLQLRSSVVSSPSFEIRSKNERELATITIDQQGRELVVDKQDITIADRDMDIPAKLEVELGIGQPNKWFVGGEYGYTNSDDFTNRTVSLDNVTYENAWKFGVGGFYIPKYNALTGYFKRVTYRAGFRYEETPLHINNHSIDEFGISFGVGLPVRNGFSNLNLGFEYGQRGTTDFGLVREDFFNFSLSLSLNDKWFRKIKFN
ncbi:hypothetical protein HN014_04815 [Aquimarina sp. TRL1]|uniref:OmpP1/FadL family transporter n=1 Tax=Aquimarina sp. (strain TRL1) TaxID=2736252 RepID=UPI0015885DB0|nr:hypothetical protein [Aquimarina sp. TRL1]QKX04259.1 hypothetical protein HN014_04815 [Aquimarina sp. TRL1]